MSTLVEMSDARKNHLEHKPKTLLAFRKKDEKKIVSLVKIESSFCEEKTGVVYASIDTAKGMIDVSSIAHLLLGSPVGA